MRPDLHEAICLLNPFRISRAGRPAIRLNGCLVSPTGRQFSDNLNRDLCAVKRVLLALEPRKAPTFFD